MAGKPQTFEQRMAKALAFANRIGETPNANRIAEIEAAIRLKMARTATKPAAQQPVADTMALRIDIKHIAGACVVAIQDHTGRFTFTLPQCNVSDEA